MEFFSSSPALTIGSWFPFCYLALPERYRAQLTCLIDSVQSVDRFATHSERGMAFDEISRSSAKYLAVIYDQNGLGHLSPQICPGDRPTLASTLRALPYQKSLTVTIRISSYFADRFKTNSRRSDGQQRFGCFLPGYRIS